MKLQKGGRRTSLATFYRGQYLFARGKVTEWKMIAARTLKSKEAIEDLADSGESIEDIEIAASNAEKALNSIGLTARTSNGDFKDLEGILGEVAAKWDTLNNSTKQYVSEQMAGNNRRSFFIGLMDNYDRNMELQHLADSSI